MRWFDIVAPAFMMLCGGVDMFLGYFKRDVYITIIGASIFIAGALMRLR